MARTKTIVKRKKMGRPVTVKGENFVGIRLPTELLDVVDKWARRNTDGSRSAAIRRLIERGLKQEED